MSYLGHVKDGVVIFDNGDRLPDGTTVRIEPLPAKPPITAGASSWSDELKKLAGSAGPGLPDDLADNHDHYLYGTERK